MVESADFENTEVDEANANPDPITGEPGSHPLGTGIGAAAAGAAATVIGATAGPVGAVVGAVVGSVVGGLVGKSAAEATNPTINPALEDHYWRESYSRRHYARPDRSYEAYQLAYQVGYEGYIAHADENMSYAEVEPELEQEYDRRNNGSSVNWEDAKYAVKDAWERAKRNDFFFNEDLYWRDNYRLQPYYNSNLSYQDYQPAYRTGYEGYVEHVGTGKSYSEIERELRQSYDADYASSALPWEQAIHAVRDAWNRAEDTFTRH